MAPVRKHIPERSCMICGTRMPKRNLLRIVRTPAGRVEVDQSGRSAGRGAYVCALQGCRESMPKRIRRLEQVLKLALPEEEKKLLLQRIDTTLKDR
ncbi:MAG: YlxR family protein [Chloroflexi bacterium]|nr:YlxR family protein [Chloroflexota bacterium]